MLIGLKYRTLEIFLINVWGIIRKEAWGNEG